MICHRCLRAAAILRRQSAPINSIAYSPVRSFSTSFALRTSAPLSAAQPPSSSVLPTTSTVASTGSKTGKINPPTMIMSSVPAGTQLRGLNFLKNKGDPIAMEDSEYPAWLWDVLKQKGKKSEEQAEGDLFSKSKKQRRLAAKRLRKQALRDPESLKPKIPIYEQSVDLPSGNGTLEGSVEADKARESLRKAMREKRRSTIKEANFLKAMG